jgi:hypothetical protein
MDHSGGFLLIEKLRSCGLEINTVLDPDAGRSRPTRVCAATPG